MKSFYLDVDGVLTDGTILYDSNGKSHKTFGPDDADALRLLQKHIHIEFVTADVRGLGITRARVERDMGFKLSLVPIHTRFKWLMSRHKLNQIMYMGAGFADATILQRVSVGIAPNNAHPIAKKFADFVTVSTGGHGAVAEACMAVAKHLELEIVEFDGFEQRFPDK